MKLDKKRLEKILTYNTISQYLKKTKKRKIYYKKR